MFKKRGEHDELQPSESKRKEEDNRPCPLPIGRDQGFLLYIYVYIYIYIPDPYRGSGIGVEIKVPAKNAAKVALLRLGKRVLGCPKRDVHLRGLYMGSGSGDPTPDRGGFLAPYSHAVRST